MFKWESKLVRIATKIVDVLILNTLFIITSLPMFTFGASWISCIEVSKKVFDESCTSVVVEYFKTFKSNFSRGVGLTFPF